LIARAKCKGMCMVSGEMQLVIDCRIWEVTTAVLLVGFELGIWGFREQ
jgi:hypothetical protein